jgi:hypothetical protein
VVVNYRIVKRRIIEIEVAILRRLERLTVNLVKGGLDCQSINESYENVMPKSSIILMSAVSGVRRGEPVHAELQLVIVEEAGSFGVQKKVVLPMCWVFLA